MTGTAKTTPEPIRDPETDHLLTPDNCVVVFIDFQQGQYATVGSTTRAEIDLGAITLAKLAHSYRIPTVLTTVAVGMGVVQAGAQPITSLAFGCELMRNWARPDADLYRAIINDYFHRKRAIHATTGDLFQ
ncbi:hypothetical protein [Nocardia testacea]|uniref:Isochorismatase family protein n=1 Tax=Nocardia testacea TaxID=248551 RepID=A0ABW7VQI7_9NOCA